MRIGQKLCLVLKHFKTTFVVEIYFSCHFLYKWKLEPTGAGYIHLIHSFIHSFNTTFVCFIPPSISIQPNLFFPIHLLVFI
jgi:hypothetical protein